MMPQPMGAKVQGSPLQNAQYNPPRGPMMARDNRMQVGAPKQVQPAPQPATSKTPNAR